MIVTCSNISFDVFHEIRDGRTVMIASDIGMDVLPSALDSIVVRAVRRKKVEDDAASFRRIEA